MVDNKYPMLSRINKSKRLAETLQISIQLLFLNLIFIAVNRLIESALFISSHHLPGMHRDALTGLFFDVSMICLLSVFLFFIIYVLMAAGRKTAISIVAAISFLFHFSHQPIAFFYIATLTPLDRLLFTHSVQEIKTTVSTAGINFYLVFALLLIFSLAFWLVARKTFKVNYFYRFRKAITAIVLLLAVLAVFVKPGDLNTATNHSTNIIRNKTVLFYQDAFSFFALRLASPPVYADVAENAARYHEAFDHHDYVSSKHAFLNKRPKGNPWGPFFEKTDTPPSVFFIFIEGLGNDFLAQTDGVMLMPFLDSLKHESLYYDHFLGTGEGSYAVLPSMIGSLPHGERGFSMLDDMPLHLNLINLLKPHGYTSGFYYGQGGYFHEKETYLKRNMIDRFVDKNVFDDDFFRIYDPHSDYHWGYHDQDLFRNYLRFARRDEGCRKLEIIFTGSMHSPFVIDREEHYNERYDRVIKNAALSPDREAYYNTYRRFLRTLLFTDDALKIFFDEISEMPCFKHSIFIITGDHPMREVPNGNALKKYHVPLLVYSPLLKETRRISSVASQFDVAPALLNLLEENYGLEFGAYSHMYGLPADTSSIFNAKSTIPLMRGNRHLDEMVHENYFFSQGELFEIQEGFALTPSTDTEKLSQLKDMLQAYRRVNDDVVRNASLLPDSLFFEYSGMNVIIDTLIDTRFYIESSQAFFDLNSAVFSVKEGQRIAVHVRGELAGRKSDKLPAIVFDLRTLDDEQVHWESIGLVAKEKSRHLDALVFFNYFGVTQAEPEHGVEYRLNMYFFNDAKLSARFDKLDLKVFATVGEKYQ